MNELLEAAGVPSHEEPEELPLIRSRSTIDGMPYSFLHYLRRAAAHRRHDPTWMATPVRDGEDPSKDSLVDAASYDFHLLIRGDFALGSLPAQLRNILHDTIASTDLERKQPTKNTEPSGTGKKP